MGADSPKVTQDSNSNAAETADRISPTAWASIVILFLCLVISSIDRLLPVVLMAPLKAQFDFNDFEAGLLIGPAFGIFYALMSYPMGWIADRFGYRHTIAGGLTVWSVASASSAFATSFEGLMAARCVVAIAEAALSPAAYALIGRRVPPKRLAFAYAIYAAGATVAFGIAILLGGWFGQVGVPSMSIPLFGELARWQACFVLTGATGLALLPLVYAIREDPAKRSDEQSEAVPPIVPFLRQNWRRLGALTALFSMMAVIALPLALWAPPHAQRTFGPEAAAPLAIIVAVASSLGGLINGHVGSALRSLLRDPYVSLAVMLTLVCLPLAAIGFLAESQFLFLACIAVAIAFFLPYSGYALAAIMEVTPQAYRARTGALFLTAMQFLGNVIGPPLIGGVAERLGGEDHLGRALAVVISVGGVIVLAIGGAILTAGRRNQVEDSGA